MKQFILLLMGIVLLVNNSFAQNTGKILLKGRYLNLVGGFNVPNVRIDNMNLIWSRMQADKLPGTNKWAMGHPSGYVLELLEPDSLGKPGETWPTMIEGRNKPAFSSVGYMDPQGVFWLNENELLTSGRRVYRGLFIPNWMAKINIETGEEILYTVRSEENTEADNFHLMEGLGAGFVRLTDTAWANANANGNNFLVGRGGYDVLNSPLGPAVGVWNIGDPTARFLLDFPKEYPLKRDPYYSYFHGKQTQQLPMWQDADSGGGYWQAGDVGGVAIINHPEVKGVIASHNHGRGLHDYRAQGDVGSGDYFLVENPAVFYSTQSSGGNRSNHEEDVENAPASPGVYARVGHVFDPDHLAEVGQGTREAWECPSERFEWPRAGIDWTESGRHTIIGQPYWDNERQLLWIVLGMPDVKIAAYEIIVDDSRPEESIRLPEGWEAIPAAIKKVNENNKQVLADIYISPNPFNPSTTISFENPESDVAIDIYDLKGRIIKNIAHYEPHYFSWNASALSAGIYQVRVKTHNQIYQKSVILLK
jgi:hypothetical protein